MRLAIALLFVPAIAAAQVPDAGVPEPAPSDAAPQPTFEPPKALGSTDIADPPEAPAITAPVVVTVKLRVDATGAVAKVELVTAPQPPFDDAVTDAVKGFQFQPGTFGDKAVPVEITFTHTFLPRPPPPPPAEGHGPARSSVLRGKLVELGTRIPLASATVVAEVEGTKYTTEGDAKGHFRIELPPGAVKISVFAPAHAAFEQRETLAAKQELAVSYYVERDRYDPYEIVVTGEQRREEVSRITLRGAELQQVPGTFGDPFRVVQALPGVASVVSLLPFPVIRGSSPASTGFLIDGTRVPLLFHLLSGPSVIHPDLIDEISFYPGGAPASYGGYTGGIVDGKTVRGSADNKLIDLDANFLTVGGLVREPIHSLGLTFTAAARYGYPGFILSLATNQASLSYWDYQLRVDGGTKANGWTVFAFGANDELDTVAPNASVTDPNPPLTPSLILGFHRLDMRYHRTLGGLETTARLVLGYDRTYSMGTDFSVLIAEPQLRSRWKLDDELTFNAGLDGSVHALDQGANAAALGNLSTLTKDLSTSYVGSVFADALWRPTTDWLIRPGIRGDVYKDATATKPALDPRLTVRRKLATRDLPDVKQDSDDAAIWLKGSAGIYHQPPRFVVPLPGLDEMPLKYGLVKSYQSSLGLEVPLAHSFQLSTEAYYNYMDPTIFDLSINAASVGTVANPTLIPTSIVTTDPAQQYIDRLTTPQTGRSYGLELLLKRQAKSGVFGWISYTLSKAERYRTGAWAPYDFDRTHLFNLVLGVPLRRNWDLGVRMQYQSGLPATTTSGYNTARADGYVRFDVRIDKRAVWQSWLLDFYVDITNIALLPEEITPGNTIRYVLPTIGLRGRI
jgi:TonB family protein